jgi:hypothetical protein
MSWVVAERRESPCATVPFGLHGLSLLSRACSETPCEQGSSLSRAIASVVAGAIEIGRECADNEETMEVCGFHGFYRYRRSLLVVHGLSAP